MSTDQSARLQFLGQAGYLMEACGVTVVIDPYLSDSVAKLDARFARQTPIPMRPQDLRADYYIVTHDHLDHLDPETIEAYPWKKETQFIAPRHAARTLRKLGVENITVVDHGDRASFPNLEVEGVFALGTGPDVLDTTGYKITFANGRTVYHSSDTGMCNLLLQAAPNAEVLLCCINGKDGNLSVEDAVRLTCAVAPRYVIPNHYDVMALNAENPLAFAYAHEEAKAAGECKIMKPMEIFEWRQ